MEKLKLHTPDFTQENIAKLAELFPNCITESADEKGAVKRAIDFDLLRQEISSSIVEGSQERYQLNWPGKREALLTANAPIAKTLRPCREESVDFDTTQNLFIEGDNLDALKLLRETYLNKVKMIYIDPPYNTGNDFIYEDDFAEDTEGYLERSNQKDEVGNRLIANTEANGRFHSDWLSMMYSRLKLARNLLRDDGIIFISIDAKEQANLKRLCDEVFGESNHIGSLIWRKKEGGGMADQYFATEHEYVVVYVKSSLFTWKDEILDATISDFPKRDENGRAYKLVKLAKWGNTARREDRPTMYYPLIDTKGKKIFPIAPDGSEGRWRVGQARANELIKENLIEFAERNDEIVPYEKIYFQENSTKVNKLRSILYAVGGTASGTNELTELFEKKDTFENPKPTNLIKTISRWNLQKNDLILDFFSGSSTTAHAVMDLNVEDGGERKFIMVQIPEVCSDTSEAHKAGYKTIAEIGKERIRRAGKKIIAKNAGKEGIDKLDIGFRVLKIDSSNMSDVFYSPDEVKQGDLLAHINNIREGRNEEDLLFQVLLDWGVDLSLPITREVIAGKNVFFVDGNALAACFEVGIDESFVKLLAAKHPLRAVFFDASFASDSVKINIEQIFKLISPTTEIKTI